jgi:competence protein ComEC
MPLLKALVPMVAGIVAGTMLPFGLYVWVTATVVCGATAGLALWRRRGGVFAMLYVGLAIVFFGAALARMHAPQAVIPRGERVWMEIAITDNPLHREGRRGASSFGEATRWRPEDGEWQPAGERLLVSIDTMWRFSAGDRVVFRGYVNPVSDTLDSYFRLMAARGYTGRTYISQYSKPAVTPASEGKTPGGWAKRLQIAAKDRLGRLDVPPGALAVATAMTTGDRTGITPALRRSYARTGASHLLAVSGLHVGIVFLIINALLYLLPLVPRGHIVKNVVAIAAIWFYAALTGLSPSAMRAAVMFTGAQVALATSWNRGAANIMCGTAIVMLAVRPGLLFDISFQLSFLAVAAILAWFSPLYSLVRSHRRLPDALWATLVIGIVATVATAPLVSHTFGVFSLVGVVLNPVVIATAYLIVGFSLVWIAMPAGFWEPLFRWLVGGPAWLQNLVVESVANVPGAAIEWTMPLWGVFVSYAVMIIFTAWLGASRTGDVAGPEPFILPR